MSLTSSRLAVRGAQSPRIRSVPPREEPDGDSPGVLAVQFAETAGLVLDPWQRSVLVDALALRTDGKWAAREVGLCVPRQQGKGSVLEALELAALFLPEPDGPPPLILHSAHEYKTADEHFRRMRDLIEGNTRLRKQIRIVRTASGAQAIELVSGARLRFVTRTSGSGRGFSPDLVVMDEAYNLSDEAMAATMFALSARPNPQLWYTSSAGMPSSSVLARVRSRGMAGDDPTLAYFEWSAPDNAELDDPEAWAQANPALGTLRPNGSGLALETVQSERLSMPDEQFARERLGMWADTNVEQIVSHIDWSACASPSHVPTGRLAFALDVDSNVHGEEWCAIAASDGVHLEVVTPPGSGPGLGWVVPAVVAKRDRFDELLIDPAGPAGKLIDPLEAAGVTVRKVKPQEFIAACGQFVDAVNERRVVHIDQPVLNRAIAAAARRDTGDGAWRLSRTRSKADISPLVAVALARWAGEHPAATKPTFAY